MAFLKEAVFDEQREVNSELQVRPPSSAVSSSASSPLAMPVMNSRPNLHRISVIEIGREVFEIRTPFLGATSFL